MIFDLEFTVSKSEIINLQSEILGMAIKNLDQFRRTRRHSRLRNKLLGTTTRPRLNIFRSARHIHAQIIDDSRGHTLVAASTLDKDIRARAAQLSKVEEANAVGQLIAERALAKGIKQVVFDRGGFRYQGRVKSLADASRKAGLEF